VEATRYAEQMGGIYAAVGETAASEMGDADAATHAAQVSHAMTEAMLEVAGVWAAIKVGAEIRAAIGRVVYQPVGADIGLGDGRSSECLEVAVSTMAWVTR
jgi:hypothetical protein